MISTYGWWQDYGSASHRGRILCSVSMKPDHLTYKPVLSAHSTRVDVGDNVDVSLATPAAGLGASPGGSAGCPAPPAPLPLRVPIATQCRRRRRQHRYRTPTRPPSSLSEADALRVFLCSFRCLAGLSCVMEPMRVQQWPRTTSLLCCNAGCRLAHDKAVNISQTCTPVRRIHALERLQSF